MQKCKILFLCTGNSARSIIAEQLVQRISKGVFHAFSAGSKPSGQVHPMALRVLKETYHIDTTDARSKSWDEFIQAGMAFDFVITFCDRAKETCPIFPGQPITAHWGSPDPVTFEGDDVATNPAGYVHPKAIAVLKEIGIDISNNTSNAGSRSNITSPLPAL